MSFQRIIDIDWLLLLLMLPLVIFPGPYTAIVLIAVILLLVVRKHVTGQFVQPTPADIALLLFLVSLLVSLFATFDAVFSVPRVIGVIYGIAFYYAVVSLASRSQQGLTWGIALLLCSGFAVAILSLFGTHWTHKLFQISQITARLPRLIEFAAAPNGISPNQVAGTLLFVLPLYAALAVVGLFETSLLRRGPLKLRWLIAVVGLGFSIVLVIFVFTQSRSGFAGLLAAAFLLVVVKVTQHLGLRAVGVILLLILAASLLLLTFSWFTDGPQYDADEELSGLLSSAEITLDARLEIWSRALYGLEDFPLTGMGMGTFRRIVPTLYPLFLISPDKDIAHAHNHLLQAGLDLGLPGLVAYLALWLLAGMQLWKSWLLRKSRWQGALAIGLAGGLVGHFVYGMTDAVALGAKPGIIFWLLLGLITGTHQLYSREQRQTD